MVAFDGMDEELIREYNCENLLSLEEFGSIDNDSGMTSRVTSELFASFITGETHEEHGIKGLITTPEWKKKFVDLILHDYLVENVRGFNRLKEMFNALLGVDGRKYKRDDLECETIFEEIGASKALYVPSYNPEFNWVLGSPVAGLGKGYSFERVAEEARHDTGVRLRQGTATQPALMDISKSFWDFVMVHFHDPDTVQDIGVRGSQLKEDYERLDSIAGEIIEEFGDEFEIIFMSDHGMIETKGKYWEHNKNAFYASTTELFSGKKPQITDFYDKIVSKIG